MTSQLAGSMSEQRGDLRPALPRGQEGSAVLYVTSEVGEAITASHRLIVMSKGRFIREFDPRTATRDDIMAASGEHDTHYRSPEESSAEPAEEAAREPARSAAKGAPTVSTTTTTPAPPAGVPAAEEKARQPV